MTHLQKFIINELKQHEKLFIGSLCDGYTSSFEHEDLAAETRAYPANFEICRLVIAQMLTAGTLCKSQPVKTDRYSEDYLVELAEPIKPAKPTTKDIFTAFAELVDDSPQETASRFTDEIMRWAKHHRIDPESAEWIELLDAAKSLQYIAIRSKTKD